MEAWRRALDEPVRAFPIEQAGPAHIATLKTFEPPLSALDGRRLAGAERRGKRLLFPTEDGELVLLVHLMTAGRLRYLAAGAKGPKAPAFRLRFEGGAELVLTEAGSKKRAGVWLLTPEAARRNSRTSDRRHWGSAPTRSERSWLRTRGGSTRCFATSARSPASAARGRTRSSITPSCLHTP